MEDLLAVGECVRGHSMVFQFASSVVKTLTKGNLKMKGLFQLRGSLWREARRGLQSRNLEFESEAEGTETCC